MAPGTRFLVEDIAREGCDGLEDIKCMKQVGPEELVAQAKGKYSWSFVRRQIVSSKSMSKSLSEILSNHNKHLCFFFKTKHELKCQNELFFNVIRSVCFDY